MGSTVSRENEHNRELKIQINDYNDQLQRALIGCGQARRTFTTLSDLWCEARNDTIQTMADVADGLDNNHRGVNIANLGGAASCVAGGTAGIASIVLAPVTGGMSVALAAGGIFGTVAGSATVLAANMAEVCLTKELMEKIQKVLNADSIFTKALRAAFKEVIIHENEVINIVSSIETESGFLQRFGELKSPTHSQNHQKTSSPIIVGHLINLVSCIFEDDEDFLQQLKKTERLINETPTITGTLPTSSEFFQALKEVSSISPEETLKRIGETAVAGVNIQSAASSVGAQLVSLGLGAIFVALDLHHLIKTSKNFDEGSKTELAQKIRLASADLQKELDQILNLNVLFKNVDS